MENPLAYVLLIAVLSAWLGFQFGKRYQLIKIQRVYRENQKRYLHPVPRPFPAQPTAPERPEEVPTDENGSEERW